MSPQDQGPGLSLRAGRNFSRELPDPSKQLLQPCQNKRSPGCGSGRIRLKLSPESEKERFRSLLEALPQTRLYYCSVVGQKLPQSECTTEFIYPHVFILCSLYFFTPHL